MPTCDTCGNTYDKTFTVLLDEESYVFDSFECAIQRLAVACGHCGTKIIGHGVEENGRIFCCAHCARSAVGTSQIKDRAP